MPGVRIRPTRQVPLNALCIVRDLNRPFPKPKDGQKLEDVQPICSQCGVQHFHKTYHIQLSGDGTAIVSETIWRNLQAMVEGGGFEFVNYVERPPTQTISGLQIAAQVPPGAGLRMKDGAIIVHEERRRRRKRR